MSLSVINKNNKFKKLLLKIRYLRAELKDVEEDALSRILLFRKAVANYCLENNLPLGNAQFDDPNVNVTIPSREKRDISKFIKKLYRNIASITHPDKTYDLPKDKRAKLNSIFVKCNSSISNGFIFDILEAADELNIEVENITLSELVFLHEEISEIEKSINNKKNTYSWIWFSNNKDKKYIKQFLLRK